MSANEQKTSRELAIIAAQAADEKKATDILVQDVAELVGETDFFGMSRRNFAIPYPIFLSNSN